jgi:GTP-binding protein
VAPERAAAARAEWFQRLARGVPVILTSALTRQGVDELAGELMRRVPIGEPVALEVAPDVHELAEHRVFRPAVDRAYRVERTGAHSYAVRGSGVERLVARYDLENEDALAHLERRLRGIGVVDALEAQGFAPGDDVEIAGVTFELDPNV